MKLYRVILVTAPATLALPQKDISAPSACPGAMMASPACCSQMGPFFTSCEERASAQEETPSEFAAACSQQDMVAACCPVGFGSSVPLICTDAASGSEADTGGGDSDGDGAGSDTSGGADTSGTNGSDSGADPEETPDTGSGGGAGSDGDEEDSGDGASSTPASESETGSGAIPASESGAPNAPPATEPEDGADTIPQFSPVAGFRA